jgi:hypothetical protein
MRGVRWGAYEGQRDRKNSKTLERPKYYTKKENEKNSLEDLACCRRKYHNCQKCTEGAIHDAAPNVLEGVYHPFFS